jgi:hypothetical protein
MKKRFNIRYDNENYVKRKDLETAEMNDEINRNRYSYQNQDIYTRNRGYNIVNMEENHKNPVNFDKGWDNILNKSSEPSRIRKLYTDPYDFTNQRELKRNFMNTERKGKPLLT